MRYVIVENGLILSRHRLFSRAHDAWGRKVAQARRRGIEFHGQFVDLLENRVVVDGKEFFDAYPIVGM